MRRITQGKCKLAAIYSWPRPCGRLYLPHKCDSWHCKYVGPTPDPILQIHVRCRLIFMGCHFSTVFSGPQLCGGAEMGAFRVLSAIKAASYFRGGGHLKYAIFVVRMATATTPIAIMSPFDEPDSARIDLPVTEVDRPQAGVCISKKRFFLFDFVLIFRTQRKVSAVLVGNNKFGCIGRKVCIQCRKWKQQVSNWSDILTW
jgi:hypothetical protein